MFTSPKLSTSSCRHAGQRCGKPSRARNACAWPQYEDGKPLFNSLTAYGLVSVVAKPLDAPYRAVRSDAWLKVRAPDVREQIRR